MNENKDPSESGGHSSSRREFVLPTWLDSRTIAVLTTTITVALGLAAMIETTYSRLGDGINQLRQEMRDVRGDMTGMRNELRAEIRDVRERLSTDIEGLDARLRTVEIDVAAIRERLSAVEARTHGEDHWESQGHRGG